MTGQTLFRDHPYPGRLVVVEGIDGSGKSTQLQLLHKWLSSLGYRAFLTEWNSSALVKQTIKLGKKQNLLTPTTFSILHATDFADRLAHLIIPPLKAGMIVLADRYVYTAFARAIVRGADRSWIRKVFGFALKPDAVFYMHIGIEDLIPRVINGEMLSKRYWDEGMGEGLDYWESGMDLKLGGDFYDSFIAYQKWILREFSLMSKKYGFVQIDASRNFHETNNALKQGITSLLSHG